MLQKYFLFPNCSILYKISQLFLVLLWFKTKEILLKAYTFAQIDIAEQKTFLIQAYFYDLQPALLGIFMPTLATLDEKGFIT